MIWRENVSGGVFLSLIAYFNLRYFYNERTLGGSIHLIIAYTSSGSFFKTI